jgi:hypothetical protein
MLYWKWVTYYPGTDSEDNYGNLYLEKKEKRHKLHVIVQLMGYDLSIKELENKKKIPHKNF